MFIYSVVTKTQLVYLATDTEVPHFSDNKSHIYFHFITCTPDDYSGTTCIN